MIDSIRQSTEEQMKKSIAAFQNDLSKIRTGRAHPSLVENIMISAYGTEMPLNQVASLSISDPRTLLVVPFDRSLSSAIEKAILKSDLGLNPVVTGQNIRIPLPPMTEERRKDLIKHIHGEAENARIAVRNVRREAVTKLKDLLKNKKISEDEEYRAEDHIQKITDQFIQKIDQILEHKEKELKSI